MLAAHRTEERRIAEGEDPAVGGHLPVAAAVGGHREAYHGFIERLTPIEP